jgi:hypothetical protein
LLCPPLLPGCNYYLLLKSVKRYCQHKQPPGGQC